MNLIVYSKGNIRLKSEINEHILHRNTAGFALHLHNTTYVISIVQYRGSSLTIQSMWFGFLKSHVVHKFTNAMTDAFRNSI